MLADKVNVLAVSDLLSHHHDPKCLVPHQDLGAQDQIRWRLCHQGASYAWVECPDTPPVSVSLELRDS